MGVHELAGLPVPGDMLVNVGRLVSEYYTGRPDPNEAGQAVSFGTSGHRGSSFACSFNEGHILAVTQAVCEYRAAQGITGPLYMGMDTHALSEPAHSSALEVLAANGVETMIHQGLGYTPTPVISHAVLTYNRGRDSGLADGVVITPSHNPPDNGGFKYNPPHGGPAGGEATSWIQNRANVLLAGKNADVKRMPYEQALKADTTHEYDYITPYVDDLENVIDMAAISRAGVRLGADPMGGSGVAFWEPIGERYNLDLAVLNPRVDPTFAFMRVDRDGKVRMDCSSPYAMAGLLELKEAFDVAFGNDPDFDRHGIVTAQGLMNPNHYLAVAINYLYSHREQWGREISIGKTVVTSGMVDRVAASLGRELMEVPVGFKWFVDCLLGGSCGFGGEESAGASFLRKDGTVWTTDKDGIILALLAGEIMAVTGKDPSEHYQALAEQFGDPLYERLEAPATVEQKAKLKKLSPDMVTAETLAGEPIEAKLTHAPGNNAAIGGLKVAAKSGWFAARPSGTEAVYKIYAESFLGPDHLKLLQQEAQAMVDGVLAG